jgi:ABC-type lipoprotein release transport system permease subunit
MGIRTALGASRRNIAWMVVRDGMSIVTAALVIGLAAAAGVARLTQSLLFGVQPLDAVAFLPAPTVLGSLALLACLLPALRAAAIDPVNRAAV